MKTLISHTLRSIRDNIGQLAIIILTVTVVSMLFFVTLTIGDIFTNVQIGVQSRLGKDTDVTVTATVFSESMLDEFCAERSEVEYTEKFFTTPGLYKPADGTYSKTVFVEATDLRQYALRHAGELTVYDSYEYSSDYPAVWIGRSFAERNGISVGDKLEIYLETYKSYAYMTVNYIFENYGIFANSVYNNVLTDFSTVGNKGLIGTANIKLKEGADKERLMTELSDWMGEGVTVRESVDFSEVDRIVSSNQRLLRIALIFVTALMIFILFTSFLIVAKKRINELTVFKTVGATNAQIAGMLAFEGLFYGFGGAVLGTILGRIGMAIAVKKVIPNFPDAVTYSVSDYVFSVLFGMAVSGISSVLPIIKAAKESVRSATGNKAKAVKKRNPLPLIVSTGALALSAVLSALVSDILCIVALVLCAGVFTYFLTPYLLRLVSLLFRGRGVKRLAGLTVKRNPSGNTLSGAVAAIMVFTFVIVCIVDITIGAVTPKNARFDSDFVVDGIYAEDLTELRDDLSEVYGVKEAFLYVYDTFIWKTETINQEYTVYGTDTSDALGVICSGLSDEAKRAFDTTLNPVIITYDLSNRFGLRIGDKINLTLGTKEKTVATLYDEFTVVGIDGAVTANDRLMVIRRDSFRVDGRYYNPADSVIFLFTDKDVPTEFLYRDLRDKVESRSCYILELSDWAYATEVGITGIATLLRILQVFVSAVALAGVINLTAVAIMERRREYEIFRATGMDGAGYVGLAAFEGLIISLTGTVIGILLSAIVNILIPDFAAIIDRFIVHRIFTWELAVIAAVFVVAYTAVYTLTALFRKKNTIERNMI